MKLKTSKREITDLLKAWIAISIAFGIILKDTIGFQQAILVAAFSVGLGFLLHEFAHKIAAQHYKCFAEFRSFDSMLLLSLIHFMAVKTPPRGPKSFLKSLIIYNCSSL